MTEVGLCGRGRHNAPDAALIGRGSRQAVAHTHSHTQSGLYTDAAHGVDLGKCADLWVPDCIRCPRKPWLHIVRTLAKVRVAGSNSVVRSKEVQVRGLSRVPDSRSSQRRAGPCLGPDCLR